MMCSAWDEDEDVKEHTDMEALVLSCADRTFADEGVGVVVVAYAVDIVPRAKSYLSNKLWLSTGKTRYQGVEI